METVGKRESAIVSSKTPGRPIKSFTTSSERTKRRKAIKLAPTASTEKLVLATKSCLYSEGKRATAELLIQATQSSPTRSLKIKKAYHKSLQENKVIPYTNDEALAYIIDYCKLEELIDAEFIYKWGCDGSSGYTEFHRYGW
ncbi:hypothetical protein ILUMI_14218 [Ignelater luminosus]|uniref:Uncharacterized protein n=1 Tax=Ignelater luminosus TaxID=2038154 RepID=A0A8K0CZ44_IGNLU|nr:hypothetical protein ILUMI_14218 [Ignelater luminosus]